MSDEAETGGRAAGPPAAKRRRGGGSTNELKRVAEIAMVLSALAEIRGGRDPTPAERSLVAEARRRLAAACESVRPKELFAGEAVRVVVEDLGLNRSKDPLIGFRAPKMSIAEKIQLTKKKMEESKELSAQSSGHPSQLNAVNYGGKHESQGSSHGPPRVLPDKSSTVWPPTGGLQTASHTGYASQFSSSISATKQLQVNDPHGSISSANSFNNPLGVDTQFKPLQPEGYHFRLDMQGPGSTHSSQVRGYLPERNLSTPIQPSSTTTSKAGESNKQPNHGPVTLEGANAINVMQPSHQQVKSQEMKTHATSASPANLLSSHQPPDSFGISTPVFTSHNDIAKYVQGFIQPKVLDQPSWTPPSTEYMNSPISCEICKMTITDVESLLICDHCDKGTHLKCLQSYGNKSIIPKSDWHCPKCLLASHGKPLPPKYGRVTRAATVSKGASNPTGNQSHPPMEKRAENVDGKPSRQKQDCSRNPSLPNYSQDLSTENKLTSDFSVPKTAEIQYTNTLPVTTDMVNKTSSDLSTRQSDIKTEAYFLPPVEQTESVSKQTENRDISPSELQNPATVSSLQSGIVKEESSVALQPHFSSNYQFSTVNVANNDENPANQTPITTACTADDSTKSTFPSGSSERQFVSLVQQPVHGNSSLDNTMRKDEAKLGELPWQKELPAVDWFEETLDVAEEKTYYQSCRINGNVYKLEDDVIATDNQILKPLKLLALWEDNNTSLKWALFRRYYLPSELPGTVPQPQVPESNEVYASDNEQILLAGVISGHCEVLGLDQLREAGARAQLPDSSTSADPIFLCRWKYDESGGAFQLVAN